LTDLKDFVFLPISSKEKKILRDYFNQ